MENEEKKIGIKETKEVLIFGLELTHATDKSLADDNKITLGEWYHFTGAAKALFPALSDIDQVPRELGDVDDEEAEEIKQLIKDRLDLTNDTTEDKIKAIFSHSMDVVISLMKAVAAARS